MNQNRDDINKNSPIPLYYQIEEIIKDKIKRGTYLLGKPIPTEKELEDIFKVSRTTIRQAINNLKRDGYLEIKRSKGTFVKTPTFEETIAGVLSYTNEAIKRGLIPSTKILNFKKIKAPLDIKEMLGLDKNEEVFYIKRLRFLNGVSNAIDTAYIPLKLVPEISEKDFKETGNEQSLYYILEKKHNLILSYGEETIDAVAVTKEESLLLEIPTNSPVIYRTRITFLPDGTPACQIKSICKNRYKILKESN